MMNSRIRNRPIQKKAPASRTSAATIHQRETGCLRRRSACLARSFHRQAEAHSSEQKIWWCAWTRQALQTGFWQA